MSEGPFSHDAGQIYVAGEGAESNASRTGGPVQPFSKKQSWNKNVLTEPWHASKIPFSGCRNMFTTSTSEFGKFIQKNDGLLRIAVGFHCDIYAQTAAMDYPGSVARLTTLAGRANPLIIVLLNQKIFNLR